MALDQLSTSATSPDRLSPELQADVEFEFEQSRAIQAEKCDRGAPFIFFVDNSGRARIVQGCCNNWTCRRCGQIRARHEYGRIVAGAKLLAEQGHDLYFWTLTCRGRELSLSEAEDNYLKWTKKLLDASRIKAKREEQFWCYAQITERQQRQHPHSHMLTTFVPADARPSARVKNGKVRQTLESKWFAQQNARAGLGREHEISLIDNPQGAAAYVSKYLFKSAVATEWPKGWRRVRYSQNWPKLPQQKADLAWPLLTMQDWLRVERLNRLVYADSITTLHAAYARLITCVILIDRKTGDENVSFYE